MTVKFTLQVSISDGPATKCSIFHPCVCAKDSTNSSVESSPGGTGGIDGFPPSSLTPSLSSIVQVKQ